MTLPVQKSSPRKQPKPYVQVIFLLFFMFLAYRVEFFSYLRATPAYLLLGTMVALVVLQCLLTKRYASALQQQGDQTRLQRWLGSFVRWSMQPVLMFIFLLFVTISCIYTAVPFRATNGQSAATGNVPVFQCAGADLGLNFGTSHELLCKSADNVLLGLDELFPGTRPQVIAAEDIERHKVKIVAVSTSLLVLFYSVVLIALCAILHSQRIKIAGISRRSHDESDAFDAHLYEVRDTHDRKWGDSIYFLGFILTLAALVSALSGFGRGDSATATDPVRLQEAGRVLASSAIALTSTIVGLILRTGWSLAMMEPTARPILSPERNPPIPYPFAPVPPDQPNTPPQEPAPQPDPNGTPPVTHGPLPAASVVVNVGCGSCPCPCPCREAAQMSVRPTYNEAQKTQPDSEDAKPAVVKPEAKSESAGTKTTKTRKSKAASERTIQTRSSSSRTRNQTGTT